MRSKRIFLTTLTKMPDVYNEGVHEEKSILGMHGLMIFKVIENIQMWMIKN